MCIDIHRPELEAFINERLRTGAYQDAEDVIWQEFRKFCSPAVPAQPSEAKNLVELFADSPFAGLEIDFEGSRDFGREIDL